MLKCSHDECNNARTFRSNYELKRHIRAKHDGQKPFVCPFPGCFKGKTASMFPRSDKVLTHIRGAPNHQRATVLKCPAEGCSFPAMELGILGVHIRGHHLKDNPGCGTLKAVANAASSSRGQCPLWSCRKQMPLTMLIEHLMAHTRFELEAIALDLYSHGYLVVKDSCTHLTEEKHGGITLLPCPCPVTGVMVICPVCAVVCGDHADFEAHVDETHLVAARKLDHFLSWRQYAREHNVWPKKQKFRPWSAWPTRDSKRWCNQVCPGCDHVMNQSSRVDHQINMLADEQQIRPYRGQILSLYPDFATHPVWSDLAEPVTDTHAACSHNDELDEICSAKP